MSTKTRDARYLPVKLVKKVALICALNCIPVKELSGGVIDKMFRHLKGWVIG